MIDSFSFCGSTLNIVFSVAKVQLKQGHQPDAPESAPTKQSGAFAKKILPAGSVAKPANGRRGRDLPPDVLTAEPCAEIPLAGC
jgi:hypothetical protein